jgi:hypothetical protein
MPYSCRFVIKIRALESLFENVNMDIPTRALISPREVLKEYWFTYCSPVLAYPYTGETNLLCLFKDS